MASRFYTAFVMLAWSASMTWLVVAKIWPTLVAGSPPDYASAFSEAATAEPPAAWRIFWKDRSVGSAASRAVQRRDGTAIRYVVRFERLPLQLILSEAFGLFGSLLQPAVSDDESTQLDLLLATEIRFDRRRQFAGFQTVADLADIHGFLTIHGNVDERRKLNLITRIGGPPGMAGKQLRQVLDLPGQAVVQDAFAPRSELRNLRVGQKWTIPVYRPFPPNSPVQVIAAHAQRHELLLWEGQDIETILVVYHNDAGTGLSASREPVGREWIRADGVIVQQEIRWSGTEIRFERVGDPASIASVSYLLDDEHARLWSDD